MNGAQIHLVLNHIPILGIPMGLLFLGASLYFQSEKMTRFSLFFLMLVAVIALPVFLTGEEAEEVLEKFGKFEAQIEAHEFWGKMALISSLVLGGASIITFISRPFKWSPLAVKAEFLLGFVSLGLLFYAGHLGGLVRHPELSRSGVSQIQTKDVDGAVKMRESHEHDDDD
jgi:hypothetical protein